MFKKMSIKTLLVPALLLILASCEKTPEQDLVAVASGIDVEALGYSPEECADINVTWGEMQKIIDRLLAARRT